MREKRLITVKVFTALCIHWYARAGLLYTETCTRVNHWSMTLLPVLWDCCVFVDRTALQIRHFSSLSSSAHNTQCDYIIHAWMCGVFITHSKVNRANCRLLYAALTGPRTAASSAYGKSHLCFPIDLYLRSDFVDEQRYMGVCRFEQMDFILRMSVVCFAMG